jgi:lipopolysaccharide export system permease protein
VRAVEAELRSNPGSGVLLVICRDGSIEMDGTTFEFSDTFEREIQLLNPGEDPHAGVSPSQMPLNVLPEKTAKQVLLVSRLEQQQAAGLAFALTSGDFQRLAGPAVQPQSSQLAQARSDLHRMRTEPPRRWANGFSCLCFAMVGAPMAILRRYSDTWATFFVCFLPILIIYYPLMMYSVGQAKTGTMPPVTVWLGNVVLMAWGAWLLRRVYRY